MMKLEYSLTRYTKINSKRIKDPNVRLDTVKLLEENIGRILLNHSKVFFDPPARVTKINKIFKCDLINLKKFCIAKETINKTKRQLKKGRKYLQTKNPKRINLQSIKTVRAAQ